MMGLYAAMAMNPFYRDLGVLKTYQEYARDKTRDLYSLAFDRARGHHWKMGALMDRFKDTGSGWLGGLIGDLDDELFEGEMFACQARLKQ